MHYILNHTYIIHYIDNNDEYSNDNYHAKSIVPINHVENNKENGKDEENEKENNNNKTWTMKKIGKIKNIKRGPNPTANVENINRINIPSAKYVNVCHDDLSNHQHLQQQQQTQQKQQIQQIQQEKQCKQQSEQKSQQSESQSSENGLFFVFCF